MTYINDKKTAEIRNALNIIIRQVGRIDRLLLKIKSEKEQKQCT